MAQSARAYAPDRRYEEFDQPQIQVHPGQGRRLDAAQYQRVMAIFKFAIAAVMLIVAMSVVRVWLTTSSMDMLTQTSQITSSIDEARTIGDNLEVQYFAMTNPSKVKAYASTNLGMAAAATTTSIDLTPTALRSATPNVVAGVESKASELAAQQAAAQAAETVTSADEGQAAAA